MTQEIVNVDFGRRSYDVKIGPGIFSRSGEEIAPFLERPRVAVVTDEAVAALHLDKFRDGLRVTEIDSAILILPKGEISKNWDRLIQVTDWLLEENIERGDLVIALGGGVIGDLVGFASAILRRGVRFIQVPTSLLAQVDSSVGGKTGINVQQGKNLIGAIHQPSLVLADTDILDTLDARNFLSGYGEIVSNGLLGDADFFDWLEENGPTVAAREEDALVHAISRSVKIKAEVVTQDETEKGNRALLNLGHTFGHAFEIATNYSDRLLHGEGVAIGCVLAFELSVKLGHCPAIDSDRVQAHFKNMGMKTKLSEIQGGMPDEKQILRLMAHDKKVVDGKLHFILVRGIGEAFMTSDVPLDLVRTVLKNSL